MGKGVVADVEPLEVVRFHVPKPISTYSDILSSDDKPSPLSLRTYLVSS